MSQDFKQTLIHIVISVLIGALVTILTQFAGAIAHQFLNVGSSLMGGMATTTAYLYRTVTT